MLWRLTRKGREKRVAKMTAESNARGAHCIELAGATVSLTVPAGTVVDAFSEAVGSLELPDGHAAIIYSVSSYDVDLHGLRRLRPAEAALGEGEELVLLPSQTPDPAGQHDYESIHFVHAHDGPYAGHGGYLMRLQLHDDRYLRALRLATTDPEDVDKSFELISDVVFATASTAIDLDQAPPGRSRAQVGPIFRTMLPPGWTCYFPEPDEEEGEEEERLVCVAPDERAFASIEVSPGGPMEGSLPSEMIDDLLDRHREMSDAYFRGEMNTDAVLLERTAERSLVVAREPVRDEGGHFTRLYAMLSVSPRYVIQINARLGTAGDEPSATDWRAAVDAFEPCLRAARIYHPHRYVVGG